jgi:surface protein
MAGMYSGCTALESITFGDLNTASVKDFSEMFRNCAKLAALDLSSFDTRGATAMRRMFHGCDSLASVTLGNYFGFRGAATYRLPGGEFPNGAWRQDESDTAYVSNSIPSMKKATYARCTDEELAQAGLTLVEVRIEGTEEGEPRLQIDSEIVETDGELVEELEYSVNDEYPSETLFVGDSPRAASTKTLPSSTTTVTKTTLRSVKNNSRITKVVVPSKVSKIASRAFSACKSVKTLTVKSPKLTTRSSVYRCLSGSNINKVTVSSISSSKKTSVRRAFAKWSGKTIRTA